MKTSESITKIASALLKAQMNMGNALKDSKNPFFKSKYADLNSVREACMPSLNANGITALQPMVNIEGKNFINTILLHESGEYLSSLTEIIYSKQNDAQAQGSGITYARRYGLQSFVNIGAEDDDGNKASQPKVEEKTTAIPIQWLTNDQFDKTMLSDKKGILSVLSAFNGQNGKKMTSEQLTKLTNQLNIAK
jgi:hypothetical protein